MVESVPLLRAVLLLLAACVASAIASPGFVNYLVTAPQNPLLQIGTNFTATCFITNTSDVTVDDLRWKLLAQREIPPEQYTKINESALNVTIPITDKTPRWLFCSSQKPAHGRYNSGAYMSGIYLKKGYFPRKPENLSCRAVQDKMHISQFIHCKWEPKQPLPGDFSTMYTVNVNFVNSFKSFNKTTSESSADVDTEVFPNFIFLDVWVEAENELGKMESEHLLVESNSFIKTNPPSDVNIISEDSFPTSLLINWTRPIDETQLRLIYEIRFAPESSYNWSYVPRADTSIDIQSFRLQNLRPDTAYITQLRCKNDKDGYWSEWSNNSTKRTPSSKPSSKPDVWHITLSEFADGRQVQLLCKEPEFANGKIVAYQISVRDFKEKLPNQNIVWERIPNANSSSALITVLKQIHLNNSTPVIVKVTAVNLKGKSPVATIVIPGKENVVSPVQRLEVYPDAGKLLVEWTAPNNTAVSEYLVQWTSGDQVDWQREKKNVRKTFIRGNLERFVMYNVSVYPLYSGWIGNPVQVGAYLEQGAPLDGPTVKLKGKPGCTEAHLIWEEIPKDKQRGFILNYTIFYSVDTDGTKTEAITVPSDTFSYTLKSLVRNQRYDTWISVSNVMGSHRGVKHSFTTLKYAPGEIEGIVVGVSLCFLFFVVLTMLICVCKRDVIKDSFWPKIPNPGASTIGTWSPDHHIKAETSSENCLSGVSVLDVDVCDGKSFFEEDKACLPLKKDKYMSEEHSSGIGGSSCMSSPRQSVSDSDEGGDIADTTASTVQYSSVVASSGYKGQTPSLPAQQAVFSRSESTQPLLESEENPDMLSLEGSRQSRRFPPLSHCEENSDSPNQLEMEAKMLDFCPVGEDSEDGVSAEGQSHEWLTDAPISSYMPQLGGYRQQ
ncbi:interleukin-6 receptor subunit beta [Eucyclogobius newberryi]|uniref:interleukin-6 receptor subunit beta n=1 Tax=Eucyclogobius newberryi TaxID=166745 RepID=UPI003B5BAAB1